MTAKSTFDNSGDITVFRIVGASQLEVEAELAIFKAAMTPTQKMRIMGPIAWGDEYVVHGEIRDF